jgi:hypothetical protein
MLTLSGQAAELVRRYGPEGVWELSEQVRRKEEELDALRGLLRFAHAQQRGDCEKAPERGPEATAPAGPPGPPPAAPAPAPPAKKKGKGGRRPARPELPLKLARALRAHGPQLPGALARLAGEGDEGGMKAVQNALSRSDYFERDLDGWHLTAEGRAALEREGDDDAAAA